MKFGVLKVKHFGEHWVSPCFSVGETSLRICIELCAELLQKVFMQYMCNFFSIKIPKHFVRKKYSIVYYGSML